MQIKLTFFAIIIIALISSACSPSTPELGEPTPNAQIFQIHPIFREFYIFLGGEGTLGPVISDARENQGIVQQYFLNAELVYDPAAEATQHFHLGPLGYRLKVAEKPDPNLTVADPFLEIYAQLKGEVFAGKPLTDLLYNQEKARFEQYFENVGFYTGEDSGGTVNLLPYGLWLCDHACRIIQLDNASIGYPTPNSVEKTSTPKPTPTPMPQEWRVQVWESLPLISSLQSQQISVSLLHNDQPLADAVLELYLTLPDNSLMRYDFPATGPDGMTSLTIPPIEAANDSVVPYQVCLHTNPLDRYCTVHHFVIFGNP